LQQLLGKKTLEAEILKEALDDATSSKKSDVAVAIAAQGRFAMKTICETIGVARSNVAARAAGRTPPRRRGRPPLPEDELLAEIRTVIADLPSYGYARVWAVQRRRAVVEGRQPARLSRHARPRSASSSYGLSYCARFS
jgi:hypothetical protein